MDRSMVSNASLDGYGGRARRRGSSVLGRPCPQAIGVGRRKRRGDEATRIFMKSTYVSKPFVFLWPDASCSVHGCALVMSIMLRITRKPATSHSAGSANRLTVSYFWLHLCQDVSGREQRSSVNSGCAAACDSWWYASRQMRSPVLVAGILCICRRLLHARQYCTSDTSLCRPVPVQVHIAHLVGWSGLA